MKMKLMFCAALLFVLIFPLALKSQNTVTDIDGNVYPTVKIGTQVWMAENLKTTKYRNGDLIPNVKKGTTWKNLNSGAYCIYNNDSVTNKNIYGALCNFYAVTDSRNIAPQGWHVPTDAEWKILTDGLGGEGKAGGAMKLVSQLWIDNVDGRPTKRSGFNAVPGGSCVNGGFNYIGYNSAWWSKSSSPKDFIQTSLGLEWNRYLSYNSVSVYRVNISKQNGYSVRCVKD